MSNKFYITTPIYYVNAEPHIGTAYTIIAADTLARYRRLQGYDVFFLTGTDEHGQKIEEAAQQNNQTPIELADRMVERFKKTWKTLNISYDDFIRTTEPRHISRTSSLIKRMYEKGDIYLGQYEGWYCIPEETFLTKRELQDGRCPSCGRKVERVKEETYFFRLSRYRDRLLKMLEENPGFVRPESRRNEVLSRIRGGLNDVCITRSTVSWGIPFPENKEHTLYVWIDALCNYITALGLDEEERFKKYWPADVHLMAKDIIWFHGVIWPAMLMSLGLPLPTRIFAHGWWNYAGDKMSKSLGNVFDPNFVAEKFGTDATRYFLLREVPFGQDGNFSLEALAARINSDLANDLGNLLHRTLNMINRYQEGVILAPTEEVASLQELASLGQSLPEKFDRAINNFQFSLSLEALWELIRRANRCVEENKPWELARDEAQKGRLATVLYNLAEALRLLTVYLSPFLPTKSEEMRLQLGLSPLKPPLAQASRWGGIRPGTRIKLGKPVFPRVELPQE